jgi:hypothetical protein
MNIDQPGHNQLSGGIERFDAVGLVRGFDRLDTAMGDRYIAHRVKFP